MSVLLTLALAALIGCGETPPEERDPAIFPKEELSGFSNGGGNSSDSDGSESGTSGKQIDGLGFSIGATGYTVGQQQITIIDNQASITISALSVDAQNVSRTVAFTFLSIGVNFPAEFELTTEIQNLGADTAVLNYSEAVTSQPPNVATAVASGLLSITTLNDEKIVGTFSFDANLASDEIRSIKSGSFSAER